MAITSVGIRTRIVENVTYVDLRISHPMESGTRKDKEGVAIPAWYLTKLALFYNDEKISELELGPVVSRNPAVSLVLNGGAVDDVLKVTWLDSRGEMGENSVAIS